MKYYGDNEEKGIKLRGNRVYLSVAVCICYQNTKLPIEVVTKDIDEII